MIIDLRSDTVTKPTAAMWEAMRSAELGDDVFGTDPTVNSLERKVAELFGKEAALFCPSGTMTNQIALQSHCGRLEEVILDETSHVYQYETGGYAYNGSLAIKTLKTPEGKLIPSDIEQAVNPDYDWLPESSLVVIENSCNKAGGIYYTLDEMKALSEQTRALGLKIHLDGARIFNVIAEKKYNSKTIGSLFDSISICLSKGLGAPVGSVLTGDKAFIKKSRRLRKVMGGGMRQVGLLAAAGIYALDHHVDRLCDDHRHARLLAEALANIPCVVSIRPVMTNIVIYEVDGSKVAELFQQHLEKHGILNVGMDKNLMRFVTHLDVNAGMIEKAVDIIRAFKEE
jgi:threonine aldolase